jgi:hypothetical protein
LGQALAVFQAFSLTKLRISKLLSQKLKFWESLHIYKEPALLSLSHRTGGSQPLVRTNSHGFGQALAVFRAFSLTKPRISKLLDKQSLSPKTEFLGKPPPS